MITLTDEQLERVLVGSEVLITVGEPWNFASADGEGVLAGRIVGVHRGDPADTRSQMIRLTVTPFEIEDGHIVEYLTAHRRYADTTEIVEQIVCGEDVDVNLAYDDQVPAESLPEGVSPFLLGGVVLSEWHTDENSRERPPFAICVENGGYEASLEKRKIYRVLPLEANERGQHLLRVVDESGEDYLYPEGMFVELELPPEAQEAFSPR